MLIRVLGSAAGGGFPQWNCGCPNCRGVREDTIRASARTQECVAVSVDGRTTGLTAEAVAVPGKAPVHLEGRSPADPGDSVGFRIREARTGRVLAYLSGVASVTEAVRQAIAHADAVFFDGTFWSSDELSASGLGTKRAEEMAHLPVGGPTGSLAQLAGVRAGRRIYIHVNNSNPMLREDSRERAAVAAAGWEVAWDGMEVRL